jgi:hypothetical protein
MNQLNLPNRYKTLLGWIFLCMLAVAPLCAKSDSDAFSYSREWYGLPVADVTLSPALQRCKPFTDSAASLVHSYQAAAVHSDSSLANGIYGNLHDLLFKTLNEDHLCFQATASAMAIASLFSETAAYDDKIMARRSEVIDGAGNFIEKPFVANLFATLVRAGRVEFLTPGKRQQLHGQWSDKENGQYLAIGAYDCASSKIFVDPELRPMDLALTLTHELDHLARDKFYGLENLEVLKGKNNGKVDWDLYNLADEASAILIGAGQQFQLQTFYKPAGFHPYLIDGDFNFVKKSGLLYHLDPGLWPNGDRKNFMPLNGFDRANLILQVGSDRFEKLGGKIKSRRELRNNFFNIIAENYFGNSQPFPSWDYDTIFDFPTDHWKGLEELLASYPLSFGSWQAQNQLTDEVRATLTAPSASCQLYIDSLASHGVSHYLGSQFPIENSETVTTHPCLRIKNGF